jgi:serine/threonine protein kinase, bacterial
VLSGITGSDGIAVGSNGMVYVANQAAGFFHNRHAASITEYVAGATTPTRTISGAALTGPVAIGVDASGNVYLANSDGTIPVYAAGASTPTTTLSDPSLVQPSAMAVDPAGDLYVFDYANDDIAYFPAGSTSVTQTLTDPSFANVGGSIALDPAGDLMVCLNNEIEILAAGSLPNAVVVTSYINATGSPAWIP